MQALASSYGLENVCCRADLSLDVVERRGADDRKADEEDVGLGVR